MNGVAIQVENLSKLYRLGVKDHKSDTFAGAAWRFLRSPVSNLGKLRRLTSFTEEDLYADDVIWALKNVSFEVREGEVLGLVGANGVGKSTLLKILAGITEPTFGRARVHGRVASLLEVGTGFHPELTGRENVYLNGTILGMTKLEIDRKFEEIVEFSGVEKFIDTPIKRYSSGMRVRLAFAVAAHLEPEILLIDEVLAVGDAQFQKKCLGKMGEVAGEGRTVLFVSHNMPAIQNLCERALLLSRGRVVADDAAIEVVRMYLSGLLPDQGLASVELHDWQHMGDGWARIMRARLLDATGAVRASYTMGEALTVEFEVERKIPGVSLTHAVEIVDETGVPIYHLWDLDSNEAPGPVDRSADTVTATIPNLDLYPGRYLVNLWLGTQQRRIDRVEGCLSFTVRAAASSNRPFSRTRGRVHRIAMWDYR